MPAKVLHSGNARLTVYTADNPNVTKLRVKCSKCGELRIVNTTLDNADTLTLHIDSACMMCAEPVTYKPTDCEELAEIHRDLATHFAD